MSPQDQLLGDRYRLEAIIGRGGMAEVWRARDTRLGRDVAVKRLRVDLASDPTFLERFRREAQSSAGLNHPNIVSVYDTGEMYDDVADLKVPYIVMELVQGHTLRDVLRDGRKILPERALEFVGGVLDALAYSHKAGIVHRDIKPANVMLTGNGRVKVMDFGIARAVADTSATMTQTAAVIGTAQYLSPEQARGETVDQRSDIYSAGCLLYELLVGRPPFVGDSPVSVAYQHVRENPVPPSHLDPEITPAMDSVTLKALAKDPQDRYQDATQMREDIDRVLAGRPVDAAAVAPLVVATPTAVTQLVPGLPDAAETGGLAAVGTTQTGRTPVAVDDRRRRRPVTVLLISLVVLLLAALGYGAYQVLKPEKTAPVATTTVPIVEGVDEAVAKNNILNSKLKVGTVKYVNGPDATKGKVLKQTPKGTQVVPVDTPVDLEVNAGVKMAKIPADLVGKPEADVTAKLKAAGFTVKSSPATADDTPAGYTKGQVVSVNPASGADVPAGSEVSITVATGMVKVPDGLKGMSQIDATAALEKVGLKAKPVAATTEPKDAKKGEVLSVEPGSGIQVAGGSEVTLTIATGMSTVPNLRGKTLAEATKILDDLGLGINSSEVESTTATPGEIVEQTPTDGERLARPGAVTVKIAKAPTTPPSSPSTQGSTANSSSSPSTTP